MLLGDSTARDVALAMGSWLGGLEAEQAETNRSSNAHGGGPAYESRHPSRAGIMSNASFADKADGGCGSHTIEALNLTVTHCSYWTPELMPAMLKRAAATCATRCATVAFVLFGAHYLKISPVVHEWVHSPDVYIHGKVFQPFLDFWCAHSEGRAEAQVPLVWLPLNPRCKRNLDPRIQSQMAITASANSASLHMAEVMRFPYVDINRVFARVPIPSRSTTSVSATSRRMGSTFRRQSTTCGRTTCSRSFATSAASSGACHSTSVLRRRVVRVSSNEMIRKILHLDSAATRPGGVTPQAHAPNDFLRSEAFFCAPTHMSVVLMPPEVQRSDAVEEAQAILADARRTARTSNLVSAGALLLSAFAVVLSSGGGAGPAAAPGARLVGESAAPKALNPETHYVRLEELAIYQDQIVAGAVGTEELSDASVRASPWCTRARGGSRAYSASRPHD